MKYCWSLAAAEPGKARELAGALGISPLLAQCLLNRDLAEPALIARFLEPRLKQLADPFLLPDMAAAVERLFQAREQKEPLVIFGDYDVDGVTSTTLLLEVLRKLGWQAQPYLPHRMDEGYGLSQEGVENCLRKFPVPLLLAVDCGSTTVSSIAWLRGQQVDVIVLDHHQVSTPAPAALALVNPQAARAKADVRAMAGEGDTMPVPAGESLPFSELCSVGLAFKLAHALVKRGRETGLPGAAEFDLRPLLDLVALGTIADIVPLTGENRILVSAGLERLNDTQRPGLVALKQAARSPEVIGPYEVSFQLAPRLNAAGRLETAEAALHLLMADDLNEARKLAGALDAQNRERQQLERSIAEEALAQVRSRFNPQTDFVIVEGQAPWHIGVVGIVASRVLQQFYRPTIIAGGDGAELRGSGRSIAGFDLAAALRECGDLLIRHGGHAMAAGLAFHPEQIHALRERLNGLARKALAPEQLEAPLRLDAEVSLRELSLETLAELDRLRPCGQSNPATQFVARRLALQGPGQRIGAEQQHVKFRVTDGAATHEAVWWGGARHPLPTGRFDLAFAPQINDYNGRRSVQLKVLDWRPTDAKL
jgi:single-stranded-DNA-specific exonuclease